MQVIYMSTFYTSVVLILPLVLVLTLNVLLIRALQESKRRLRHSSLEHYEGRPEANITIVMVAIIIELLLCHTPDRILQVKLSHRQVWHSVVHGMGGSVILKRGKGLAWFRRPQVAMHSQLPCFIVCQARRKTFRCHFLTRFLHPSRFA